MDEGGFMPRVKRVWTEELLAELRRLLVKENMTVLAAAAQLGLRPRPVYEAARRMELTKLRAGMAMGLERAPKGDFAVYRSDLRKGHDELLEYVSSEAEARIKAGELNAAMMAECRGRNPFGPEIPLYYAVVINEE